MEHLLPSPDAILLEKCQWPHAPLEANTPVSHSAKCLHLQFLQRFHPPFEDSIASCPCPTRQVSIGMTSCHARHMVCAQLAQSNSTSPLNMGSTKRGAGSRNQESGNVRVKNVNPREPPRKTGRARFLCIPVRTRSDGCMERHLGNTTCPLINSVMSIPT